MLNFRGYNLQKSKDPTGIYLFLVKLLSKLLGRYANLRERKPLFSSNPKRAAVQTCMLNQTRQPDNTIQYNLIQLYTVPLYTIQHSIQFNYNSIQFNTNQYNSIQYDTIQYTSIHNYTDIHLEPAWPLFWRDDLHVYGSNHWKHGSFRVQVPHKKNLGNHHFYGSTRKNGHFNNKNSNNNMHIDLSQLAILKCSITTIYSS